MDRAMDGQFSRIERMIGAEGLRRLGRAHVAVVGLGAVGSYAVEGLVRAGIGRLRLVDFDEVRPSNLNRQLYALQSTLGQAKCQVALQRVRDINPACEAETLAVFVDTQTMDRVLDGPPDLVIDAIDSLGPKVELLAAIQTRRIPVVSAMGAALRTDPGRVRVGPLSEVHHCPLASKVRKRLRTRGLPTEFACVYSTEPVTDLPDSVRAEPVAGEDELFDRGRRRSVLGSLPTLTGIFGLIAANAALRMLLGEVFPGSVKERCLGK